MLQFLAYAAGVSAIRDVAVNRLGDVQSPVTILKPRCGRIKAD